MIRTPRNDELLDLSQRSKPSKQALKHPWRRFDDIKDSEVSMSRARRAAERTQAGSVGVAI
jgi:hypothetical protein